jgi:hypothetical protein
MLVTEQDAMTLWCVNWATANEAVMPRCEGPKCMGWRWSQPHLDGRILGYCGLAGEPEGATSRQRRDLALGKGEKT